MKKIFCLSILILLAVNLYAINSQINSESINAYRTALAYYDNMEYGKALKYAEDSILYRKQESENESKILHNSLTVKKVINAGTDINNVLKVLEERGEKESIKIINYYVKLKGYDFFDNNINNIYTYISEIKVFPEAYKLIGDIYKLEGEYDFAEEYYNLALKNAAILDIPDERYDILFMLAEISKLKKNYAQMETRLLNILVEDNCYKDNALINSMMNTIKSNNNNSLEKYFNLYRANSYYCLNTYNELIQYYIDMNENEKAIKMSTLSVLTGFTKINEILERRNPVYEYTSLKDFFIELSNYSDIIEWGKTNEVWKSFNLLAKLTYNAGYDVFSKDLLKVLIDYSPDEYWRKEAVIQLDKIN